MRNKIPIGYKANLEDANKIVLKFGVVDRWLPN